MGLFKRCMTVAMALACFVVAHVHAQEFSAISGHWHTSYFDSERGWVDGYVYVAPDGSIEGLVEFDSEDPSTWLDYRADLLGFDGRVVRGSYWPYIPSVRFELTLSPDGSTLVGTWSLREERSEPQPDREGERTDHPEYESWYVATGPEIWQRLVPEFLEVAVRSEDGYALDMHHMEPMWESAVVNANLPMIGVHLTVPEEQKHYRSRTATLDDENLTLWRRGDFEDRTRFAYYIWLRQGVEEGAKTLRLDEGVKVSFDLVFEYHDPGSHPERPPRPDVEDDR